MLKTNNKMQSRKTGEIILTTSTERSCAYVEAESRVQISSPHSEWISPKNRRPDHRSPRTSLSLSFLSPLSSLLLFSFFPLLTLNCPSPLPLPHPLYFYRDLPLPYPWVTPPICRPAPSLHLASPLSLPPFAVHCLNPLFCPSLTVCLFSSRYFAATTSLVLVSIIIAASHV